MSWSIFLAEIRDPFVILPCTGLSSPYSFITHASGMDSLPLAGLRGMTTYHPMVVMSQFDQFQDFHTFEGAAGQRSSSRYLSAEDRSRVYACWDHREIAAFSVSIPGYSAEYSAWI